MDTEVDHYAVLSLPSGREGANLSEQEINKAYRSKARELHPDKRPDDPKAHANFLKLQTSYQVLKDEKARKLFDDLLRVKQEKLQCQGRQDIKRPKMRSDLGKMRSDLEEREGYATVDPSIKARKEEERIRKMKNDMSAILAKLADDRASFKGETKANKKNDTDGGSGGLDKEERMLKVSWKKKIGEDYTAQKLREIFQKFGSVEVVVIKKSKKRGSARVLMGSKDDASSAIGKILGDLSNPLLVLPYQTTSSPPFVSVSERNKPADDPKLTNLVGTGYQAFEELVLDKLKKAAQRQK